MRITKTILLTFRGGGESTIGKGLSARKMGRERGWRSEALSCSVDASVRAKEVFISREDHKGGWSGNYQDY